MRKGFAVLVFAAALFSSLPAPAQAGQFYSVTTSSIVASDPVQAGRLQNGSPTTCGAAPTGTLADEGTSFHFDRYALINHTEQPQCVTVAVSESSCNGALQSATYVPAFNPGQVVAGVAGESGDTAASYGVSVGPGQPFAVVVNQLASTTFCAGYGLTLTSNQPWANSPPIISGSAVAGETLTVASSWDASSMVITRQWRRCDAAGNACTDVPGATNSSYVVTDADLGHTLRVAETATDTVNNSTSVGPSTVPVQSGRPRPAYTRTSRSGTLQGGGALVPGSQGDDAVVDFAFPFPVSFYGTDYTSAKLGTNGVLQFQSANASQLNAGLPTPRLGPAVAGHWDDLVTTGPGEGIFASVTGDAPNRVLQIEWRASIFPGGGAYPGADTVNFAIRFTEGPPALSIVYGSVARSGSGATVGIQAASLAGLADQFSFNTSSVPGGLQIDYTGSQPSIAGSPREGGELTGSDASWIGPGPITTTLQWLACDEQGDNCAEIPGASNPTLTPGAEHVGKRLRLRSTARNERGSTSLASPATDPVAARDRPADRTLPVIGSLRLTNTTFRVARGVTPVAAAAKKGTNITSNVSERGIARYTIQRELKGRLVGTTCRKPTRKLRRRKACNRYRTVATLTRSARPGRNTLFFTGRIGRVALVPNRYRVVLRVTDEAGNVSPNRWARFRIVSR